MNVEYMLGLFLAWIFGVATGLWIAVRLMGKK